MNYGVVDEAFFPCSSNVELGTIRALDSRTKGVPIITMKTMRSGTTYVNTAVGGCSRCHEFSIGANNASVASERVNMWVPTNPMKPRASVQKTAEHSRRDHARQGLPGAKHRIPRNRTQCKSRKSNGTVPDDTTARLVDVVRLSPAAAQRVHAEGSGKEV